MYSPAVAYGTVYIASADSLLYAVDSRTGDEKWRFSQPHHQFASPVIAEGIIYCPTALISSSAAAQAAGQQVSGSLYALNAQTGQELWNFPAPVSSTVDTPALADGTLYFRGPDRYLYAIR